MPDDKPEESPSTKNSPSAHWLWRLSAHEWLRASHKELLLASSAMSSRRKCLTLLRRSAGMALNAKLVAQRNKWDESHCEGIWGRSYVDHLKALCSTGGQDLADLPAETRGWADAILEIPLNTTTPQGVVRLQPRAGNDLVVAIQLTRKLAAAVETSI